jgi:hypothetical protein
MWHVDPLFGRLAMLGFAGAMLYVWVTGKASAIFSRPPRPLPVRRARVVGAVLFFLFLALAFHPEIEAGFRRLSTSAHLP